MVDITLFELHLPNAEFNAPFASRDDAEEDATADDDTEVPDHSADSGLAPAIAALAVLIGIAWLVRRRRADSTSDADDAPDDA